MQDVVSIFQTAGLVDLGGSDCREKHQREVVEEHEPDDIVCTLLDALPVVGEDDTVNDNNSFQSTSCPITVAKVSSNKDLKAPEDVSKTGDTVQMEILDQVSKVISSILQVFSV